MEIKITLYKRHIINDVAAECNLIGRTLETAGNAEAANNNFSALTELAGYIKSPSDNETKPVVARAMSEGFAAVKQACQRFLIMGRDTDDNRLELLLEAKKKIFSEDAEEFFNPDNYDGGTSDGLVNNCNQLGRLSLFKGVKYTITVDMSQAKPMSSGVESEKFRLYLGNNLVGEFAADADSAITFEYTATQTAECNLLVAQNNVALDQSYVVAEGSIIPVTVTWEDFGTYELDLAIGNFNTGVTSTVTAYSHRLIVDHVMAAILKNQQIEGYQKYIQTEENARRELVRVLQARRSFGRNAHDWM